MTRKYFEAYYRAITERKRRELHEAAAEHFNLAPDTMRKKYIGKITVEDDEILFGNTWIREKCPITVEEVNELLSHDQTTDDRLSDFQQKVIENREMRVRHAAEAT